MGLVVCMLVLWAASDVMALLVMTNQVIPSNPTENSSFFHHHPMLQVHSTLGSPYFYSSPYPLDSG